MANIFSKWMKKSEKERLSSKGAVVSVGEESKETKKTESVKEVVSIKQEEKKIQGVILGLRRTEKGMLYRASNVYVFDVIGSATKRSVSTAIKTAFNVIPDKIRMVNTKGKAVRWGRVEGMRSGTKKAYVSLKKGDTILVPDESTKETA